MNNLKEKNSDETPTCFGGLIILIFVALLCISLGKLLSQSDLKNNGYDRYTRDIKDLPATIKTFSFCSFSYEGGKTVNSSNCFFKEDGTVHLQVCGNEEWCYLDFNDFKIKEEKYSGCNGIPFSTKTNLLEEELTKLKKGITRVPSCLTGK